MGRAFRLLLGSSWLTNLGDGIAIAAGAKLVESETSSLSLVAMSWVLLRSPWLLFGLYAGVIADRFDRRILLVVANACRAVVLLLLSVLIMGGSVDIVVVLGAMLVLGTAETFADTTNETLLPMIVSKADISLGNTRLVFGSVALNQLAGPALGGALFAAGRWIPFVVQAGLILLAIAFIWQITEVGRVSQAGSSGGASTAQEMREGLRWLRHHPAMRTLALTIFAFNVTFGAAWSVLVVLASQRLGLDALGFGVLLSMAAVGGLFGASLYRWLEQRVSLANLMRAGLLIETFTHLGLALTTVAWHAMAIMFAFGVHTSVWGTTRRSIRQRVVPNELQGRVGAVYAVGMQGGLVLGALLVVVIGSAWNVTGPFWFAFIGSALILSAIWRELGHISVAGAELT